MVKNIALRIWFLTKPNDIMWSM